MRLNSNFAYFLKFSVQYSRTLVVAVGATNSAPTPTATCNPHAAREGIKPTLGEGSLNTLIMPICLIMMMEAPVGTTYELRSRTYVVPVTPQVSG